MTSDPEAYLGLRLYTCRQSREGLCPAFLTRNLRMPASSPGRHAGLFTGHLWVLRSQWNNRAPRLTHPALFPPMGVCRPTGAYGSRVIWFGYFWACSPCFFMYRKKEPQPPQLALRCFVPFLNFCNFTLIAVDPHFEHAAFLRLLRRF